MNSEKVTPRIRDYLAHPQV